MDDNLVKLSFGFLLFILLGIFWGCEYNQGESTKHLPNIIIFLVDDAGYVDFGFMGSQDLETPNIDKLARDGVVFRDAHVSASVCAPSRAGLITGLYQQRFGYECNDVPKDKGLDLTTPTLGKKLKEKGYRTTAIGKWHLGIGDEYHPNARGFDEFYGFLAGGRSYFPDETQDQEGNPRAILHNDQHVHFEGYLTDAFGDQAVKYIEREKQNPFFMYLAFNAVHTPMHAKEKDLAKYAGHPRQELAAMTWSLDENVGKVIDKLKLEGLYENSLIFFLSDNGGAHNNQSDCGELKGWKGNKFEGGHRVPFTLTWPREINGSITYDGLTSSLDIFSTSLKAAGMDLDTSQVDGVDLIPYINGTNESEAPHEFLFWRKDKMGAIRRNAFKLVQLKGYGHNLYNLNNNLGETIDISESHAREVSRLADRFKKWESEMEDPRWYEVEDWNIVTYEIHRALLENRAPNYTDPDEMRAYNKTLTENKLR